MRIWIFSYQLLKYILRTQHWQRALEHAPLFKKLKKFYSWFNRLMNSNLRKPQHSQISQRGELISTLNCLNHLKPTYQDLTAVCFFNSCYCNIIQTSKKSHFNTCIKSTTNCCNYHTFVLQYSNYEEKTKNCKSKRGIGLTRVSIMY